jgi:2Fe-2S ferredoxin
MTTIRYQTADVEIDVEAKSNETLMQAALRSSVPGVIGECGGEMSCGTCHIYVGAPWNETIIPASADEQELLEMIDSYTSASRLACQIKCTDALDGITVEVP